MTASSLDQSSPSVHLWPLPLVQAPIPHEYILQHKEKESFSGGEGERVQLASLAGCVHSLFFVFETWNNHYAVNQLKASQNEIKEILNGKHAEFWERRSIHRGAWNLWMRLMLHGAQLLLQNDYPPNALAWGCSWWMHYRANQDAMESLLRCMSRGKDTITKKEWNRCRIIFRGGPTPHQEASHLAELLPHDFFSHTEPQTASVQRLASFICRNLRWNDHLYPRIDPSEKRCFLRTTASSHMLSVCNLNKASCKYQLSSMRSHVRIFNCTSSVLYLLHPIECLELHNLRQCTVVCGAVRKIVSISNCSQCKFIVATRCVQLLDSDNIALNCCVNIPPLISSTCSNVVIGPHNTFYHTLAEHLHTAGVNPKLNQFRDPFVMHACTAKSARELHKAAQNREDINFEQDTLKNCWRLLAPKEFTQFAIPFDSESSGGSGGERVNVCAIPSEYASALRDKMWAVAKLFDQMKKSLKRQPQMQGALEEFIAQEFQQWLEKDGVRWQECVSVQGVQEV